MLKSDPLKRFMLTNMGTLMNEHRTNLIIDAQSKKDWA